MRPINQPIELIIRTPVSAIQAKSFNAGLVSKLKKAGIRAELKTLPELIPQAKNIKKGLKKNRVKNQVIRTDVKDTEVNPWDMAHLSLDALARDAQYIEPDMLNEYTVDRKVDAPPEQITTKSFGSGKSNDDYDPDWKPHYNDIWHLGDAFSQLASARTAVADMDYPVRIAHIDTGYSKKHPIIPASVKNNPLQRNFVEGEDPFDAHDPLNSGMLKQPGHGTGTYGILAGGKVSLQTHDGEFNDFLGGAYFADIIPCRISGTVILFKTSAYAEALDYLTQLSLGGTQVHVASMSMGGAPSRIWADAVNAAYDAGIILVSAAGNNFAGLPTRHVVYPARFKRVITACGVTFDYKPYYTSKFNEMQGCFGPRRHMQKALAAFTPNMPWASVESGTIRFSGAGTSSATPQVAAAAAIYYRKHHAALDRLKPWERVEAVRYALFGSARKKSGIARFDEDFTTYYGNGIIQARDALDIPVNNSVTKTPEDEVPWFPVLNTIFKAIPNTQEQKKLQMFNTELAQLVFSDAALASLVDESRDYDKISKRSWKKFADAVIAHPHASVTLKKYLEGKNRP